MKKLAVIGASYLQLPLILEAKAMGMETHVFAWAADDVGEKEADFFYPISIVEKDQILAKCREIGVDGICSIASDLAMLTVNYVAHEMGLTGNSLRATEFSTNKHLMRERFAARKDPSPKSLLVESIRDLDGVPLTYPLIVKPTDRSGSRGITKVLSPEQLDRAIEDAKAQSFERKALVEEFAEGQEYSIEYVSRHGVHHFLAATKKYTTGAPRYIETAHVQPAPFTPEMLQKVQQVVTHALDSLELTDGASHSELKIDDAGQIRLIEIGGRMGGDCIGSALVPLSTGLNFVRDVIQIALGEEPTDVEPRALASAAIRFVFDKRDLDCLELLKKEHPEMLVEEQVQVPDDTEVCDSSSRFGYFIFSAPSTELLARYLPE